MRRAKEDVCGLFSFSFRFTTPALGTDSEKLQSVTKYLIAAPIFLSAPCKCKGGTRGVVNSQAADTSQMIVILNGSIIACLCAAKIQFPHHSHLVEQFKVAIHGSQAYFWHPLPHNNIKSCSRGMRLHLLEFFQNQFSLPGVPMGIIADHVAPLTLLVIITDYFKSQEQDRKIFLHLKDQLPEPQMGGINRFLSC
jgi:hypothetical protein